jgi:hypothetical protein
MSHKRKQQFDQEFEDRREKRLREWKGKFGPEDYQAYTPCASWEMIVENPKATWDWEYLSKTCDIERIISYPDFPWSWYIISSRVTGTRNSGKDSLIIVKHNPEHKWYWDVISQNVTYEQFKKYEHDFPWIWDEHGFSRNEDIATEGMVRAYSNKPWSWSILSTVKKVATISTIRDYPFKKWNWYSVTQQNSWKTVKGNLEIPWNWQAVSSKSEITPEIVDQYPDIPWDWHWLSWNKNFITLDMVLKNPDRAWDWYPISNHLLATWEVITTHDLPWCWTSISRWNKYITPTLIFHNQDKPWNYKQLSKHEHMTTTDLEWLIDKLPKRDWDWYELSKKISWKFIQDHLDLPWNWENLSERSGTVIWKRVQKTKQKPWDWNILSGYSHIATPENVENNPDLPWNYGAIACLREEEDRKELEEREKYSSVLMKIKPLLKKVIDLLPSIEEEESS